MCGIAGFCLDPDTCTTEDANPIAGQLLLDIEHRGYDATGSAWLAGTKLSVLKRNMPAASYIKSAGEQLCKGATTAILHTRWATQGSPRNNDNNHPITRGRIALTHNGHINNDEELFKRLNVKRRGQVDSEAVTALLAFTHENYHPTEVLPEIQGTAALAWLDMKTGANTLHLARVNSSPLHIGQSRSGHLFYASTLQAIRNAAWMAYDELVWEHAALEGEYFRVTNGRITEHSTFTPNTRSVFGIQANWKEMSWDKAMRAATKHKTINNGKVVQN